MLQENKELRLHDELITQWKNNPSLPVWVLTVDILDWTLCPNPIWHDYEMYALGDKPKKLSSYEVALYVQSYYRPWFPLPEQQPLSIGDKFWHPTLVNKVKEDVWNNSEEQLELLKNNFVHLTKLNAERHHRILKNILIPVFANLI